ncbi:uncharacterized protein [Branchiostoma lanceolatum]|uniref:uncharacterized protein n=1 Tax=Branchiostoma lanceolatum TaxID=7740 RepID=UPI0034562E02
MDVKFVFVLFALQIWATIFTAARPARRSVNDVTSPTTPGHETHRHRPINGLQTAGMPVKGPSTPFATTQLHKSTQSDKTTPIIPATSVSGFSNSVGLSTKLYTTLEVSTLPFTDSVTTMTPRITSPKGNCSNGTECSRNTGKRQGNYTTALAVTAVTSVVAGIVLSTGAWHLRRRLLLARERKRLKRLEERRSKIVYNSNPAYHRSSLLGNDKLYSTILSLSDYSPAPRTKLPNGNAKIDDGNKVTTSFTNPVDIVRKGDRRSDVKGRSGNPLKVLKLYKEGARNSSQTTVVVT